MLSRMEGQNRKWRGGKLFGPPARLPEEAAASNFFPFKPYCQSPTACGFKLGLYEFLKSKCAMDRLVPCMFEVCATVAQARLLKNVEKETEKANRLSQNIKLI